MISVSLDRIVVTRQAKKGYNLKSLRNLRQNSTKQKTKTFDLSPKVKNKLKSTLTNWLYTEGAYIKEKNKKRNTAANTAPPHIPPQKPTHKAQRGGTSSVQPFAAINKKKLTMITLTIPINHGMTDKEIKRKYLNTFLNYISRNGCTHYFWIAETQRSGNIHFHLATNYFSNTFADKWQEITGNNSPNAIKDRPVHNIDKVICYLLKGNNVREIDGRLWGCSDNIKEFKSIEIRNVGTQQEDFLSKYGTQLTIFAQEDFYFLARPSKELKQKILKSFLLLRRRQ